MTGAIAFFVLQFYEKFRPTPTAEDGKQGIGGGVQGAPSGSFDLQNVMKTAMSNLGPMLQQMGQGGSGQGLSIPQQDDIMDNNDDDDNVLLENEFN
tara:strand:- start:26864 stop:27151 length:288 start_codon:yes stop_codon:yes gene_type:complete